MQKRHLLTLCSGFLLLTNQYWANADPLTGNVQMRSARVSRPAELSSGISLQSTNAQLDDNSFNLNANTAQLQSQASARDAQLPIAVSQPEPIRATRALNGHSEEQNATIRSGTQRAGAAPLVDDYNARRALSGNVTFRFCYFDLGDGAECCWEGLRDANYLRGRGVDVAIMLDRGGVRLANKHNGHELQLHRGSTEHMVKTQQLLRDFIDGGGTVFVSERWAREFGLWGGSYPSLTQGVKLSTDEEMADLLVERSGRIVEY